MRPKVVQARPYSLTRQPVPMLMLGCSRWCKIMYLVCGLGVTAAYRSQAWQQRHAREASRCKSGPGVLTRQAVPMPMPPHRKWSEI